jgi:hypothetical protein
VGVLQSLHGKRTRLDGGGFTVLRQPPLMTVAPG